MVELLALRTENASIHWAATASGGLVERWIELERWERCPSRRSGSCYSGLPTVTFPALIYRYSVARETRSVWQISAMEWVLLLWSA